MFAQFSLSLWDFQGKEIKCSEEERLRINCEAGGCGIQLSNSRTAF